MKFPPLLRRFPFAPDPSVGRRQNRVGSRRRAVRSIPLDIFLTPPQPATIPAIEMAIAARGTRNEFAICIGDLAMIELSDDEAWLIRKINTNNGEVTIYGDITARKINRLIPEYVTQTTKREDTYTFTLTDKGKKVASAFRDKSAKD
jgi:hypothetical protein